MLDSNQVPIEQSALLVIDAQDSFKVGRELGAPQQSCF